MDRHHLFGSCLLHITLLHTSTSADNVVCICHPCLACGLLKTPHHIHALLSVRWLTLLFFLGNTACHKVRCLVFMIRGNLGGTLFTLWLRGQLGRWRRTRGRKVIYFQNFAVYKLSLLGALKLEMVTLALKFLLKQCLLQYCIC